jgi:hypothetical protein
MDYPSHHTPGFLRMAKPVSITEASAILDEHILAQWRLWRSYLSMKLELRRLRVRDPNDPLFDLDEDADSARQQELDQRLKAIPAPKRALFDQCVDDRREQIQHAAEDAQRRTRGTGASRVFLDPEEAEHVALQALLDECNGTTINGLGNVPMDDAWYTVEVAKIDQTPTAHAYQLSGKPGANNKASLIVLCVGVLTCMWYMTTSFWGSTAGEDGGTHITTQVLVDDQPFSPWPVQRMTLISNGDQQRIVDLTPADGPEWIDTAVQPTVHTATVYPVTLCLLPEQVSALQAMILHGTGQGIDRRYRLTTDSAGRADLTIATCGDTSASIVRAVLESTTAIVASLPGEGRTTMEGFTLTVVDVAVRGSAQDPGIPTNDIQVALTVQGLDSTVVDYNPTLLLETGEVFRTPVVQVAAGGAIVVRYTVPATPYQRDAIWLITEPATGVTHQWRIAIAPPVDRATELGRSLRIDGATARRTTEGILVALRVTNQQPVPLTIRGSDVQLVYQGKAYPMAELPAQTILPAETVTLTIPMAARTIDEASIRFAGHIIRVTGI